MIDHMNDNQCPLGLWAKLHPKNKKKEKDYYEYF